MRRLLVLAAAALALASAAARGATGGRTFGLPAWSPDGTRIAWVDFGGGDSEDEIWTASADGSDAATLLTGFRDGLFELVWTTADTLLFDANFQLFRATPDGRYRHVTPPTGSTFATDAGGTRVASVCDRCNGPLDVWSLAGGRTATFGGTGVVYGAPTLSPDGRRVAFVRSVLADPKTDRWRLQGLWVARTDGRGLRRLDPRGTCATWSPAGDAIAYLTPERSSLALRTIAPDGSHRRLLLARGPICSIPASFVWSPDGTRIAYLTGARGRLVLLDVASRHTTPVAAFGSVTGVAWSPDATRLLVAARPRPTACSSLWVVGADGKGAALVRGCG